MTWLMQFLGNNPFVLLFLVVGLAVWIGSWTVKGYGLGTVAAAIIVGCGFAILGSLFGVRFHLDDFTKSLFYYLFMYGVGLRVGPSFVNGLKGDGLKFAGLAVLCSCLGLAIVVAGVRLLGLPVGAAGGILAGAMTMSAAIGSAEQAVTSGAVALPAGTSAEQASGMIALSYGITYIWGTVGIILICKYLPRWWGVDAKAAARQYETEHGVPNVDDAGLSGYQPFGWRAYRVESDQTAGKTIADFRKAYPEYQIDNVARGPDLLGADASLVLQKGDVVALGGGLGPLTDHMGIIGPEVPNAHVLNIPLDQAEIVVTSKQAIGRKLRDYRQTPIAGQVQLTRIERGGVPIPIGLDTELQRFDVLFLSGLKSAIDKAGEMVGRVARHNTSTDLLTLSLGMILGFLIGLIEIPAFGAAVGLGNAGGLLVSGIIVSSVVSRLRFFGNTPNAARNILEDMGLIVFVAIVGVNAGADLLSQLTGAIALKIFIVGFLACSVPPFVVWAIGFHVFRMNPALLMGGVAGARSHSGPAREAAKEIGSNVPWIAFPVGYAVSGVLLTVFGYVAMVLAH
ncbi:aspartate:alanine exchanger family transporter [Phreatobacter stygius]|uniref:Transporter n=1 Tax=Phreatobacter stygius TaxID=1940610 RepID=A0A4D7BHW6_9HYPH|nr:TrkA C-terminal domain-containing protein [Phreatobacter stygius]QCI67407.1 transporter [Phreatobacter stygius]